MTYDLSVIIPARNEEFLSNTVEDLLKNIRGNTEIIAVLDGYWPNPPIKDDPKVTLLHFSEAVGQRAGTNYAARISKSKYLAKTDAHCAFDEGFDVKLMEKMQDNFTMVPIMRNLHVFDWVCKCGDRRYQGNRPTDCPKCDNKTEFHKDIVWIGKSNPQCSSYCFDPEPHFQYFREFKSRPEGKGELTETMSLQGSFFMCTREKYHELNLCDEEFGNWGSQGIEISVKTWLSGGRVVCNHNTWYAHCFRTKGGDFGFPWPASGRQIQGAKRHARELFFNNRWPQQTKPLSWLVRKFWPVPGWTEKDLEEVSKNDPPEIRAEPKAEPRPAAHSDRGIVYYSDNRIDDKLGRMVQQRLLDTGLPIVSVTLKPIEFGDNVVLNLERGYLTMFKQILAGLERIDTELVWLCEHDVLYTPEHFEFTPLCKDRFYYNKSNWQVRQVDGHAVFWDCKKVSQVCAYRELFLKHYRERVRKVEEVGFSRRMGFEPGTHGRPERVDDYKSDFFETKIANLDVRHKYNLTSSRWSPDKFRNPCKNWTESHVNKLPGWEDLKL